MSDDVATDQETQYVKDALSSGHMVVEKEMALRLIARIEQDAQRIAELEAEGREIEDREASVCPEDYSFDEYIRALEAERNALREKVAAVEAWRVNGSSQSAPS
jgi:hypothetical protein